MNDYAFAVVISFLAVVAFMVFVIATKRSGE